MCSGDTLGEKKWGNTTNNTPLNDLITPLNDIITLAGESIKYKVLSIPQLIPDLPDP